MSITFLALPLPFSSLFSLPCRDKLMELDDDFCEEQSSSSTSMVRDGVWDDPLVLSSQTDVEPPTPEEVVAVSLRPADTQATLVGGDTSVSRVFGWGVLGGHPGVWVSTDLRCAATPLRSASEKEPFLANATWAFAA